MDKTEHVGVKAARQRQERYWNAHQLRSGYSAFQVRLNLVETTDVTDVIEGMAVH